LKVLIAVLLAALAVAASLQLYRTRELRVQGRMAFALLRAATLSVVILLLFDPVLPGRSTGGTGDRHDLIDASESMEAVLVSGTRPRDAAASWSADRSPAGVEETDRIADAAARAIEAGAGEITVATDLRLRDAVALRALASRAPARIEVVDLGGPVVNVGISQLELPSRIRPGETARAIVRLHGEGAATLALVVSGDTLARTPVLLDAAAREQVVALEFTLPESTPDGAGALVAEGVLELEGDGYSPDDRRLGLLQVDDPGGGLVVVSGQPDWEIRTLLPVLNEVAGIPVQGFLKLSEGRYLTTGVAPSVVSVSEVREALAASRLTLLHGMLLEDPEDPVLALARRSDRILEIGPRGAGHPGLGTPQPGEWYIAAELPPSPIAAELAGIQLLGLPPLSNLRPGDTTGASPLSVQRGGTGTAVPAFSWIEDGAQRRVVARAEGFWRWGMRDGAPRELYRRLWSGVVAWLLEPLPGARAMGMGPVESEVEPGRPIDFRAGLLAGGTVELVWTEAGSDSLPTLRSDTLAVDSIGRAVAPPFSSPGVLGWRATGTSDGDSIAASGLLIVQGPGDELRISRDTTLAEDLRALGSDAELLRAGRPVRSHPVPWILLVLLLSVEWIGRRRSGLR